MIHKLNTKILSVFLMLFSFSAFGQVVNVQLSEQIRSKVVKAISEEAGDFFTLSYNDHPVFINHVIGLNYITPEVIGVVHRTIGQNEAIEASSAEYMKKNPGTTSDEFDKLLLERITNPLKNYTAVPANSLLTFLEMYYRQNTSDDQFMLQRTYFYLSQIRSELKLPAFDAKICATVIGTDNCPKIKVEPKASTEPNPYRRPSSLRLEKK